MKVVQIIDPLKIGGAQKLMAVFVREMLRCNPNLKVISLSAPEVDSPIYQELIGMRAELQNIPLHSITDLRGTRQIAAALRASSAQLVHTQLNYANIHGTLAAKRAGLPSVTSLHKASVHLYGYKPYRIWLETRILSRYSQRILACGNTVARVQQPRFKSKSLDVIANPVPNLPDISAEQIKRVRHEFMPLTKGILMISVGRLIPEKGYSDLIQAFGQARQTLQQPVRLLVVGTRYLMAELQAEVKQSGLQDDILLTGERDDVPALLAASRCVRKNYSPAGWVEQLLDLYTEVLHD